MDIEKAKKLLNGIDIKFFLNGTIEQSNYVVDKADETNLAIETVLNELEKKEAEIDKLRNTNKDLLKKLRNRVKEVKKLTRYSLYKKEFARLNKQLEKKDTVINEAISYIENTFELEDEKCITELYDILKKAEEK